jgi:outer membrane protein TolC
MKILILLFTITLVSNSLIFSQSQTKADTLLQSGTLQNCIQYALEHQPQMQQTLLDEQITEKEINGRLSEWYPQINFNFNIQHNYELPVSIVQGNVSKVGLINTTSGQFSATQNIFNRDAVLASSTAGDVRKQASQITINDKISVIVNVSKAFYSVLLAQDQIKLINEDITRLGQNLKDTYSHYKSGVVDKTDYMRASITLNNALTEKVQDTEQLKVSVAHLKELMGYSPDMELRLEYDRSKMENDILTDTTQKVFYENRIEYQLLQTQYNLQAANLKYYEWSFIPSIYAFGEYNFNYQNDQWSKVYNKNYPNSYIGIGLSLPIFEGGKRLQEISQAELELKRFNFNFAALKVSINTEYNQAIANYKSDLANYNSQKNNLDLAKEVYNIIQLQYKSGVKTYLEVITAESDLRTTEVNYVAALYKVLSSKLDVQKALGTIKYQ